MKKSILFVLVFSFLFPFCNLFAQEQSLQEVCEVGSFSEIKDAILAGAKVNDQDENGRTALMAVCESNYSAEVIQLLLVYGAKVNLKDNKGRTALMYAAQYDQYEKVFQELIKAGANVNDKANDGTTALMLACENTINTRIVSLLISAGANINDKDNDGYKAIDYVVNNEKCGDKIKDILKSSSKK